MIDYNPREATYQYYGQGESGNGIGVPRFGAAAGGFSGVLSQFDVGTRISSAWGVCAYYEANGDGRGAEYE